MSMHTANDDLQLTRRIGFADLHSDLPLGLLKRRFDGSEGTLATEWLPCLRAGGVDLVVCAVYLDSIFLPEGALRRAVPLVAALLEELAACPQSELALTHAPSSIASACACSPSPGCVAPRSATAPGRTTRAAG